MKEHGCNDKVIMPCVGQKYLLAGNIIKNISSMNGIFFKSIKFVKEILLDVEGFGNGIIIGFEMCSSLKKIRIFNKTGLYKKKHISDIIKLLSHCVIIII